VDTSLSALECGLHRLVFGATVLLPCRALNTNYDVLDWSKGSLVVCGIK